MGPSEYTDEFKAELDRCYDHYINGGVMISAEDAKKRISELVTTIKDAKAKAQWAYKKEQLRKPIN